MNNDNNPVMDHIENPHELERMFRKEPEAFRRSFSYAWERHPDSQVLAVWYERLHYKESEDIRKSYLFRADFFSMGIFAVLAGISTRIIFQFVEQMTIAPMNLVFGIVPFIAAFFLYNNPAKRGVLYTVASLFVVSGVYLNMLPIEFNDSMILVYLHLPIFLWVLLGVAFTGNEYGVGSKRLAYIKFNGEFGILYVSVK